MAVLAAAGAGVGASLGGCDSGGDDGPTTGGPPVLARPSKSGTVAIFPTGPRQTISMDGTVSKAASRAQSQRVLNWTAQFEEIVTAVRRDWTAATEPR